MSRSLRRWAPAIGCAVTLSVLLWRVGTAPFLDGLHAVDGLALVTAAGLAAVTTVCCAWRWKLVAGGLGIDLSLPVAVAAYYRSLFLNVTLPGGIVGDLHRGVSQGRRTNGVGRGMRSVVVERFAGQIVQLVITVPVLAALPSPVRPFMPWLLLGCTMVGIGLLALTRARAAKPQSVRARIRCAVARDIRHGLLAGRRWRAIALASALVVVGHTATFLLAARTAGSTAPLIVLLPIALTVLLAGLVPSVAGWGPREGVTAWAFGAAGIHAQRGVATAVVYGVIVFVASLPGAAVLALTWLRSSRALTRTEPLLWNEAAHA